MDSFNLKYKSLCEIMESTQPIDINRASNLVSDLKLIMVESSFLTTKEKLLPIEDRIIFRTILEYDAILSIKLRNLEEFSRAMDQLKCSYFRCSDLPLSSNMDLLLSIYLVYLLSLNKNSEFNIQFQLTQRLCGQSKNLEYVMNLNESVIENSFTRLFSLELNPPSELFHQFTLDLLNGVRNNHANSIEKSYERLSINDLISILHFSNKEEAILFSKNRNWILSSNGNEIKFGLKHEYKQKLNENSVSRFVDLAVQISYLA